MAGRRALVKQVSQVMRYDGATLEQVHEMLADPAFREQVCDAQGVLRRTVTIEPAGEAGAMHVTIDQVQAAKGIPGFAKKFVGDEINIVQEEHWSSAAHGDITVTIPRKPGDMSGTATLVEDDGGVTETATMDVKVHLPFVGGKIEGLVADMLGKALRAENRTGIAWLAERR
jgi:hypothetical protein